MEGVVVDPTFGHCRNPAHGHDNARGVFRWAGKPNQAKPRRSTRRTATATPVVQTPYLVSGI